MGQGNPRSQGNHRPRNYKGRWSNHKHHIVHVPQHPYPPRPDTPRQEKETRVYKHLFIAEISGTGTWKKLYCRIQGGLRGTRHLLCPKPHSPNTQHPKSVPLKSPQFVVCLTVAPSQILKPLRGHQPKTWVGSSLISILPPRLISPEVSGLKG